MRQPQAHRHEKTSANELHRGSPAQVRRGSESNDEHRRPQALKHPTANQRRRSRTHGGREGIAWRDNPTVGNPRDRPGCRQQPQRTAAGYQGVVVRQQFDNVITMMMAMVEMHDLV